MLKHPEYPFESRWLVVAGGHRLHYVDEGHGPTVLFVHGNPTWSFYFRRAISHLRSSFRCIALDHIGCGLSDHPTPQQYPYTLQRRIEDLETLVDRLVPHGPVTLVVHDWGGIIGLGWAVDHLERLAALVAMNTAAFPKPAAKRVPAGLWLARHTALGSWLVRHTNLFCQLAARWCVVRRPLDPAVRRMYLQPYSRPALRWAVQKFVQTIPLRPTDEGYDIVEKTAAALRQHGSRLPALLLWGLADFVFDQHFLHVWRQLLPQAEVHSWPDAGHYLLEDAADEVIPLLEAFLQRSLMQRGEEPRAATASFIMPDSTDSAP
ncbi:MAG: alpha/beta fold hydrolase [Gemmataceae bacterium]|nr:alpha/beta fold hydrolase [Gemmataceae bacterium]